MKKPRGSFVVLHMHTRVETTFPLGVECHIKGKLCVLSEQKNNYCQLIHLKYSKKVQRTTINLASFQRGLIKLAFVYIKSLYLHERPTFDFTKLHVFNELFRSV